MSDRTIHDLTREELIEYIERIKNSDYAKAYRKLQTAKRNLIRQVRALEGKVNEYKLRWEQNRQVGERIWLLNLELQDANNLIGAMKSEIHALRKLLKEQDDR